MSPSVAEILARRADSIVESKGASNPFWVEGAVDFLLTSEKWEATPELLRIVSQLQDEVTRGFGGNQNFRTSYGQDAVSIAELAMLRARHGENQGLEGYAKCIQAANPISLEDSALDALEPFWRFPTNSTLRGAASAMFANTNSPWGTLVWCLAGGGGPWVKPIASQALVIPEFRALVLKELANHTATVESVNESGVLNKPDFRPCDVVVNQLSAIPGFPKISDTWPETKRDEAVNAAAKLLSSSGDRLKLREPSAHWSPAFDPPLVEIGP